MFDVAPSPVLQTRSLRTPFKYPVRVTIAGQRVVRLLSGDLSARGMFLKMEAPPEVGTVVVLAFETRGRVLPFAEGEVAWQRQGGFGVRFTRFLHPRAQALVEYLAAHLETGVPLRPLGAGPSRMTALWAAAAVLVALVAWGAMASGPAEAAPASVPMVVATSDAVESCVEAERRAEVEPVVAPAASVAELEAPTAALAQVVEEPTAEAQAAEAPVKRKKKRRSARKAPVVQSPVASVASSTPLPSGAARQVSLTRVGDALRVSVDPVVGGRVTGVRAIENPPRLVIDVAGTPPERAHALAVRGPELQRISIARNGDGTRLILALTRAPARVAQQGDAALVSY